MTFRTKIFGSFGKGVDGSISLNFDVSGGRNCDTGCALHPQSTNPKWQNAGGIPCYAVRAEIRPDRQGLTRKLGRHGKLGAAQVCGAAIVEYRLMRDKGVSVPWARISTNGSVPQPENVRPIFRAQFRTLLAMFLDDDVPVHFPVETKEKRRFYDHMVGDLCTVRESCNLDVDRFVHATVPRSVVVGSRSMSRNERVSEAQRVAKLARETSGQKIVVCPAITHSWASNPVRKNAIPKNDRAKCGACTACADQNVQIVYPLH